ncbi:phosphate/phosphite/phosphonate ABC transporter substrate-binding protein [Virgibacillus sp. DJP39]|uniref:phosphate/phosphite/phosphonate ABC transporter substrate-binding protein n=1 Tax=Virgibacillus sp. DJP39 TaxID=3409790 RepID=UPI003BB61EC5
MKKWIIIVVSISLALFLTACGGDTKTESSDKEAMNEKDAFTIGVIPVQTKGAMKEAMDKLQSLLSEKLDREVLIEVFPDYNGVVEAMNYDKIDMAYLGPLTYVIAHEKSGAKAIITQLVDGEPFYHSYIITQNDSEWESLDDLLKNPETIDFAFGDINSTSGSLIPSIELENHGVYKSTENHKFNSIRHTGSHNATALTVQNGDVDAGAIDSAIYNQLIDSGIIDEKKVKIIWKSDKLFQYPWAVHKNTDKETIKDLKEAFLAIEDQVILDAFGASGFTEASNEDYESIRKAAIKQGIIKE